MALKVVKKKLLWKKGWPTPIKYTIKNKESQTETQIIFPFLFLKKYSVRKAVIFIKSIAVLRNNFRASLQSVF